MDEKDATILKAITEIRAELIELRAMIQVLTASAQHPAVWFHPTALSTEELPVRLHSEHAPLCQCAACRDRLRGVGISHAG